MVVVVCGGLLTTAGLELFFGGSWEKKNDTLEGSSIARLKKGARWSPVFSTSAVPRG